MEVKISVVIPTYKRHHTLCRAVDSVIAQTFVEVEVIVVDDNDPSSPEREKTELVMQKYTDNDRVAYIKHEVNKNGAAARNTGIRAARGKYVAFLDDDDEFTPCKLQAQFEKMESLDGTWAACYTKYQIKNGNRIVARGVENKEGNVLKDALMRNFFICAGSNLMVRKSALDEIGGFDESFVRNQDLEVLVRLAQKYSIAYCDVMGLVVNQHIGNKVDFENVTKRYLSTFEPYINSLPLGEQRAIYYMINLQRYRYWFLKRDFAKCRTICQQENLQYKHIIKYMLHLLGRLIRKESRGYNFRLA